MQGGLVPSRSAGPYREREKRRKSIGNLPDGKYQLIEDSAPSGYVIIKKEIDFEIKDGKLIGQNIKDVLTLDNNTAMITIVNEPGAALPNTGGSGTRLYTILGSILILGAGVLLWRRRRLIW